MASAPHNKDGVSTPRKPFSPAPLENGPGSAPMGGPTDLDKDSTGTGHTYAS